MMVIDTTGPSPGRSRERADEKPDLRGDVSVRALCDACKAQLRSATVVSGLAMPVAVVQDPTQANVQFVVQQGGLIRVVRNGVLQTGNFLDLTAVVLAGGERGLLGLAFAPDYATSRRFFVDFTRKPDGNTVIARFLRSASDPLRADPASRFDLTWPGGHSYIVQPFANHNAGDLQFGSDGFLYIPLGDGGSSNDPGNRAQDPGTLLGKVLRIDVDVPDADFEGYDVPASNPFVGRPGYLPEIWAFGMRNPFRTTVDSIARGGMGALVMGDVGQEARGRRLTTNRTAWPGGTTAGATAKAPTTTSPRCRPPIHR